MTGAEIIERARATAAAREAGSTKIRVSRELYERAAVCAREVGDPLGRWMRLCTLDSNYGRARDVAIPEELKVATRGSVVATVDGQHADPQEVRERVAAGVLRCEALRLPPFECALREGVDYYVERTE